MRDPRKKQVQAERMNRRKRTAALKRNPTATMKRASRQRNTWKAARRVDADRKLSLARQARAAVNALAAKRKAPESGERSAFGKVMDMLSTILGG